MKTIYFDMDGTIADLYGVDGWLDSIHKREVQAYLDAEPMVELSRFIDALVKLKELGFRIGVLTWLARGATKEYENRIRDAKKHWLRQHIPFKLDEVRMMKYGQAKDRNAKDRGGILFDDDARVRARWLGNAIDPAKHNIVEILEEIIKAAS